MQPDVEEVADRLRRELRIDGYPGLGSADSLIECYFPRLRLRERPVPVSRVRVRPDGSGVITLKTDHRHPWFREGELAEEFAHWYLLAYGPGVEAGCRLEYPERRRLHGYDRKAEWTAYDFVHAFYLPEEPFREVMLFERDPLRALREFLPFVEQACLDYRVRMILRR
jgi:hypothetical protein